MSGNFQFVQKAFDYFQEKDFKKCYDYCIKAGDHRDANTIMGVLYFNGNGVEKDRIKGIRFLLKAYNTKEDNFYNTEEDTRIKYIKYIEDCKNELKRGLTTAFKKCLRQQTQLPSDLIMIAIQLLGDELEYHIEEGRIIIDYTKCLEEEETTSKEEVKTTSKEEETTSKGIKYLIKMFENN